MARLHIISHCLPREIDDFDRMLDHLHRSAGFLEEGDVVSAYFLILFLLLSLHPRTELSSTTSNIFL